jgi:hypothetical protein
VLEVNPMKTAVRLTLAFAALLGSLQVPAQEARQLNRIATPQAAPKLPPGARVVSALRPVKVAWVDAAVQELAASWNTPQLRPLLTDNFYDKDRLLDALNAQVPRDAKLRVLGVQGIQTLSQYLLKNPAGTEELVSRVSVTVRTQVEFNDPRTGFQRLDGTNEFILRVVERAP